MNVNAAVLVGRLTRDPHLAHLPSGTAVCEFSLAINDRVKNEASGEWEERPSFIDIKVYGRQAETCGEYLAKGKQAGVSGRIRQERWEGQDGKQKSKVVVVARDVQFLSRREDGDSSFEQAPVDDDGFI